MKLSARIAAMVATTSLISSVAQTWCGKNYMVNQTVVSPGGRFQLPASSKDPLIAFRCSPVFRPYLQEDAKHAAFIIDAPIVHQYIYGASPISYANSNSSFSECDNLGDLDVMISIGNQVFVYEQVPLNTTGHEISVDLSSLQAQKAPYNVSCSATYDATTPSSFVASQRFSANASLLYLPNTGSSVVKTDLRTGSLWLRPVDGKGGDFAPFIPQGFYVSFEQLARNLSLINQLKADGFNTIHPIPPYDNVTIFEQILNRTVALGLYLVYDMRTDYQNLTAVTQQVQAYSSFSNLLLWETAHEPDGHSDPLNAARNTYDVIYSVDGYHPVSIVLNCQDYNFAPYAEGADIVLENAYPIGINATFSPVWHTPCTPDFGHCGCDNCEGFVYDIKARIQTYKNRLNVLGYDRTKAVWGTPQAFGSGAYWDTTPTGLQWAAMGLTSFSHGATGLVSFQYPTTTGNVTTIGGTAPMLTAVFAETVRAFIVDPNVTYEASDIDGVDASVWNNGTAYLLLVTNFNASDVYVPWNAIGLDGVTTNATTQIQPILSLAGNTNGTGFNLRPGGVGVYTATPPR